MAAERRQIHVLLTLLDGERSFGMSLAQKSPAVGPKYTVVSSVFAHSPAARAGVRQGYVVRCINDRPMSGLTVAQVANNFRNVAQAEITLEVVEHAASPRTSGFAVAATQAGSGAGEQKKSVAPVTGFSPISSGRAIAAPGTALATPRIAAAKQPVLRLSAKPAAKTLATAAMANSAGVIEKAKVMPTADAKVVNGASHTGFKSKAVAPVLRLGSTSKPVQTDVATKQPVDISAKQDAVKPVGARASSTVTKGTASTTVPRSPAQAITAPIRVDGATQARKVTTTVAAPTKRVTSVTTSVKTAVSPATKPATPISVLAASKAGKPITPPVVQPGTGSAAAVGATSKAGLSPSVPLPLSVPASDAVPDRQGTATIINGIPPSAADPASTGEHSAAARNTNPPAQKPAAVLSKSTISTQVTSVQAPAAQGTSSAVPVLPRNSPPPPVIIPPKPKSRARSAAKTPVRSPARAVVRSPASAIPPATPGTASTPATTKTGKKRSRPRKNPVVTNDTTGSKGKAKAKKSQKKQEDEPVEPTMENDSDLEESPSKKAARRAAKGGRRGVSDRPRHSLTVENLMQMGFTQEDAEASVKELGENNQEGCILWIVTRMEERQFNEDLNRASIQSEQSKRDEEKRVKKLEKETIAHAEKFMSFFPTSYITSTDSNAPHLKNVLESTINQVDAENYLRELLTKLLTLEGKSIRWYKEATRSYMLELAGRLETALGSHNVMTCCSRASPSDNNTSCAFVQKLVEEEKALIQALFEMPTNQGGVPPVFLECDEATKFDLEDDGFEVVDPQEMDS